MCSYSRLLLVPVFFVLLCSCACALGEEGDGNVSGPELIRYLWEPATIYEAKGIVGSGDGGFIIAADTAKEYPSDCRYEKDIILVKIDSGGSKIWERVLGEENIIDTVSCITEGGDGEFVLTSFRTRGLTIDNRICIYSVNDDGVVSWNQVYQVWGNNEHELYGPPWGTVECQSGGFVVAGSLSGDFGNTGLYLFKIDNQGQMLWHREYGEDSSPGRVVIIQSRDGGFIVITSFKIIKVDKDGQKVWERNMDIFRESADIYRCDDSGYMVIGRNVVKIDEDGNTLWQKDYGYDPMGSGCESAKVDGGYIMIWDWGGPFLKIDEDGDKVWEKEIQNQEWIFGGITKTDDYGYIVVGSHDLPFSDLHWVYDLVTMKIDSEGDKVWERIYGNTKAHNDIAPSTDKGHVIAGMKQAGGTWDGYLSKIGQDGNKLWERSYGGPGRESFLSLTRTFDGGFIAAGYTTSYGGGRDVYILRIDQHGYKIWEESYGTSEQDIATAIARTSDGGFVVAGTTESVDRKTRYVYLLKVNAWGERVWDRNYGSGGAGRAFDIAPCSDGGFIVAGFSSEEPNYGILVLKIDANGQMVLEQDLSGRMDQQCLYRWE
jgi:hypothetical protein